jgi:ribonuclease HI
MLLSNDMNNSLTQYDTGLNTERQKSQEIRKREVTLNKKNWKIEFKWVKAHAGIYGNEIADRFAKEVTQNHCVTYSRIPRSVIKKDTRKESIRKW